MGTDQWELIIAEITRYIDCIHLQWGIAPNIALQPSSKTASHESGVLALFSYIVRSGCFRTG
jgi:hypothetical protein